MLHTGNGSARRNLDHKIGGVHEIPPEGTGVVVMLKDGFAAGGVGDLDLAGTLLDPIEKEAGGGAADTPASANFHVKRSGRGKPEGVRHLRERPDQEPAAVGKAQRAKAAGLLPFGKRNGVYYPAVAKGVVASVHRFMRLFLVEWQISYVQFGGVV